MSVPETSMYKKCDATRAECKIRNAGEPTTLNPETQPLPMKKRSHGQLRFGVSIADARHDFTAFLNAVDVHIQGRSRGLLNGVHMMLAESTKPV